MPYHEDIPAKSSDNLFESHLDHNDHKMILSFESVIKSRTLDLTGLEVNQRLKRIDAEFKRIEELKLQMARVKHATKAALLGVAGEED